MFDFKAFINKLYAEIPEWYSVNDLWEMSKGDMVNIALIDAFLQEWGVKVEDCNGRIKTLRSFFERQFDLTDKLLSISWEITEHSQKTEEVENRRQNLDPVFSDKFTERMAESVAANEQKF